MTHSAKFNLPFVDPAQAQKHLPVNEGFARLDAMAQLRLDGVDVTLPPEGGADGQVFAIGAGAVNDWEGQGGKLALRDNGGWLFVTPQAGWNAWSVPDGAALRFDGVAWRSPPMAAHGTGAATGMAVQVADIAVPAGGAVTTGVTIPAMSILFGVTGRVLSDLGTGTWALGVTGAEDRYGSGLGMQAGSWAMGLTGTPMTYYTDTALVLTPTPDFDGGDLRLALHLMRLTAPAAD